MINDGVIVCQHFDAAILSCYARQMIDRRKQHNRASAARQYQVSLGRNHAVMRKSLDDMITIQLAQRICGEKPLTRAGFIKRLADGYMLAPETAVDALVKIAEWDFSPPPTGEQPNGARQYRASLGRGHKRRREALDRLFDEIENKTGKPRYAIMQCLAIASYHCPARVAYLLEPAIS